MRPTTERTVAWRWLVPRKVGAAAARAVTASWRTLEGPLPNRPSPGRSSPGRIGGPEGSWSGAVAPRWIGVDFWSVMRPLYPRPTTRNARRRPVQVPRISRRVAAIAESATLAIDAKAKALKAAGEDVIGFGAGEPDFPTPEHIVEAAVAACRDPKNHKYTPAGGLPELREAIAVKTKRDSGYDVKASQVLVTNGGKHALYDAFATLLDPGDEAILPAPYWTTYPESIKLAGGVP